MKHKRKSNKYAIKRKSILYSIEMQLNQIDLCFYTWHPIQWFSMLLHKRKKLAIKRFTLLTKLSADLFSDKAMVHEWAHLRWGVFNENPTPGYDPFHYDNDNGTEKLEATR